MLMSPADNCAGLFWSSFHQEDLGNSVLKFIVNRSIAIPEVLQSYLDRSVL
jgi:hypothetical protein